MVQKDVKTFSVWQFGNKYTAFRTINRVICMYEQRKKEGWKKFWKDDLLESGNNVEILLIQFGKLNK